MKIRYFFLSLFLVSCTSAIGEDSNGFTSSNISSEQIKQESEKDENQYESESKEEEKSTWIFSKKIKVYLNPSVQTHNMYYGNICSEADAMNKISKLVFQQLKEDEHFEVFQNDRGLPLNKSVKESNDENVDWHLAFHSNAGGGSGSESYYVGSNLFANHILKTFNKIHTFPSRGIKNGNHLYELKNSKAKQKALIEFLFHDRKEEAEYIVKNSQKIANSIVEALITFSIMDWN